MLSGKRQKFLSEYLGRCGYNGTLAAKQVYNCRSQHSYEAVATRLLKHPEIRAAIDEHFRLANMSRKEVLDELKWLARSRNHKDQIKALALLGQHFNLLNGQGNDEEIQRQAEQIVNQRLEQYAKEVEAEVEDFNRKALESNRKKERAMIEIQKLFAHNAEAVRALKLMREVALEYKTIEQVKEELRREPEVEIILPIPQQRRLAAAPIETMLAAIEPEIVEPEPQRTLCRHGALPGECVTIVFNEDICAHHRDFAKYSRGASSGFYA